MERFVELPRVGVLWRHFARKDFAFLLVVSVHAEVRADMKTELASLGKGLRDEFQNKFAATDARITNLETGFQKELRRVHEDILRWMFIYWTGLFLALCGVGVGIATYLRQ